MALLLGSGFGRDERLFPDLLPVALGGRRRAARTGGFRAGRLADLLRDAGMPMTAWALE